VEQPDTWDEPLLAIEVREGSVDIDGLRALLRTIFGEGGDLRLRNSDGIVVLVLWMTMSADASQSARRDALVMGLNIAQTEPLAVFASPLAVSWISDWSVGGRAPLVRRETLTPPDVEFQRGPAVTVVTRSFERPLPAVAPDEIFVASPFGPTGSSRVLDLHALGAASAPITSEVEAEK
jgi:hypothetical protein